MNIDMKDRIVFADDKVVVGMCCVYIMGVAYSIGHVSSIYVRKHAARPLDADPSIGFVLGAAAIGGLAVFWATLAAIAHYSGVMGAIYLDVGVAFWLIILAVLCRMEQVRKKRLAPGRSYALILVTAGDARVTMTSKDEAYLLAIGEAIKDAAAVGADLRDPQPAPAARP